MLSKTFSSEFLLQLQAYQISSRRSFLGKKQGHHLSPRKGHGVEFSEYRQYQPGDSPRHIDWNVYGRTDRLYVKQFHEEEALSVAVILDGSRSMFIEDKWQKAIDITLAIGYVALNHGDTFVSSISADDRNIKKCESLSQIHDVYSYLNDYKVLNNNKNQLDISVGKFISKIKFPGICFLISDFFLSKEEIQKTCSILAGKNFSICLVQVLANSDLNPSMDQESIIAEDSETFEKISIAWTKKDQLQYDIYFNEEREFLKSLCSAYRMQYLSICNENIQDFIISKLLKNGALQ